MKRVVVTGLGIACPLGLQVDAAWKLLVAGKSGISKIKSDSFKDCPSKIAGFVPDGMMCLPNTTKSIQLGMHAIDEAVKDSGLIIDSSLTEDIGVCFGSGMSFIEDVNIQKEILTLKGARKVSPHFIPKILGNMVAGYASIKYGLLGPNHSASTACATGAHSIGDAFRIIQRGEARAMIAGASEAPISPLAMIGFSQAKALRTDSNEAPEKASRPFDCSRSGFVISEGAGALILEDYEHAHSRNCKFYGEVVGFGMSGDAHHITATHPEGRGALLAMQRACRGIPIEAIGHINAHATSTRLGDKAEAIAISRFGTNASCVVSAAKGSVGHLLGAAGSVESIFTLLALKNDLAPPTLNYVNTDIDALNKFVVSGQSIPLKNVEYALSNSFGFGGTNVSLLFRKF